MKNKDEIIVYWAPGFVQSKFNLTHKEPEPAIKELRQLGHKLVHPDNDKNNFLKCPAVLNSLNNTFTITSPAEVKIKWDGHNIYTPDHDKEFSDKCIVARDANTGLMSFNLCKYFLFTEEPSLLIKQKNANYTNNDFTKKTGIIEGSFDIGQWVRLLDVALYIKEPGTVNIKLNDILYYIEFFTDKKIVFKKFYYTLALRNMYETCVSVRETKKFPIKTYFEEIYLIFNQSKIKKRMLKEIKDNLLE